MKELRRNEVRSLSQDHVAIDDKAGILSQLCLPSESIFSTSTLGALTEELSLIIILTKGKKTYIVVFKEILLNHLIWILTTALGFGEGTKAEKGG